MPRLSAITAALGTTITLGCSSAAGPGEGASQTSTQDLASIYAGIEPGMKVHWQRGIEFPQPSADAMPDNVAARSTSGGNLVDHGGRVLSVSHTYAIWWGAASAFPSDAQAGLDALFAGLDATSFLGIATQYMRGASTTTSFATNWSDSSSPPSRSPRTSAIVTEACNAIQANGATPDPDAIYFVFTSNFPGHVSFCAWHSAGTCNGTTIQVAYMPNTAGLAACDPGNLYGCNTYSEGTRSLANVTSHEYMEAITDPDLSAWYDSSGSEIGDKCAWQFSSCVKLATGSWQLQEEWSNSAGGCVQ